MPDREQLIASFTRDEVETAESILKCLAVPASPSKFQRLLLLFLRGHYASADNYMGMDHLACYTWSSGDASTLAVNLSHHPDDQKPDDYPGIFVSFADADFGRLAIGNFAGLGEDRSRTDLAKESTANFEITHVAKRPADAYDLATMTAHALTAMAAPLAKNGGATGFEVLGIRTPKEKKPSPESFYKVAVPVQIKYILAMTRALESHRIRSITIALTAEA